MSKSDTARANYQAAREEILERLRLREQLVGYYLAGITAICAVVFDAGASATAKLYLGCLVAYLSAAASLLLWQHVVAIEHLANFCRSKIQPFLEAETEAAPQWDLYTREVASREAHKTEIRKWSHLILIQGPALFFLIAVASPNVANPTEIAFASFAWVAFVFGGIAIWCSFAGRREG